MDIIVAVDADWGIGKDGDLLQRISADMKYFREKTTGNVLVMGRKTLESFPNKKPLPNRVNIVLTKNKDYQAEGVVLCHDLAELPAVLENTRAEGFCCRRRHGLCSAFACSANVPMSRRFIRPIPRILPSRIWMKTPIGSWRKRAKCRRRRE